MEKENQRKFIENSLPIKEMGVNAGKEGKISRGRIATIHRWWARRRQGISRSLIFSSIVNANGNFNEKNEIIKNLSAYKSGHQHELIKKAINIIKEETQNKEIILYDPFSGGGSIPLEAMRLGLKVYASDLNPLACLILKATLKFPQQYGMKKIDNPLTRSLKSTGTSKKTSVIGQLILKWGNWIVENSRKEIDPLFSNEEEIPVVFFWVHTIQCSNGDCNRKMPLSKMSYTLKQTNLAYSIELIPDLVKGKFSGKIKQVNKIGESPYPKLNRLTGSHGDTKCIFCNQSTTGDKIREMAKLGKMSYYPIGKMVLRNKKTKKKDKLVKEIVPLSKKDFELIEKCIELEKKDNFSYIPIPDYSGKGKIAWAVGSPRIYGITSFRNIFIPRQRLIISIISKWIKFARDEMKKQRLSIELSNVISLYLTFALTKFMEYSNRYSIWMDAGKPAQVTANYAYNLSWDFPEIYPYKKGGYSFISKFQDISKSLDEISNIPTNCLNIWQHNASEESVLEKNSIDIIFTDPPYYDTMGYAGLADFFYGIMKNTQGEIFPELFRDLVTPKSTECVLQAHRFDDMKVAKISYENQLSEAFNEMNRVLKDNGVLLIVFAHINLSAWSAIISALIRANFKITACWPINTESTTGAIQGRAALKATMHIFCRKKHESLGAIFFNDLQKISKIRLSRKLKEFWKHGFSGVNLDIAMLGPAFEIYGEYEKIEDERTGEILSIERWMDWIRKEVLQLQLSQIMKELLSKDLQDSLKSLDPFAQFYILFRLEFGIKSIDIDIARLLEKSTNLNIRDLTEWGYLEKESSKINLRSAEDREKIDLLINGKPPGNLITMVDKLHGAILSHQRDLFDEFEKRENISFNHPIWAIAQLISNILPSDSKESISLRNFLNVRKLKTSTLGKYIKQ